MATAVPTDVPGSYGPYGGRYVPETLVPALDELERGLAGGKGRPDVLGRARRAPSAPTPAGPRR